MSDIDLQLNRLFGIYRGKVVKQLENGILKVYIPDVYPLEWASQPDKLPDAEVMVPTFGGNNNGNGVFSYPNIGAFVICQFLNGDQNLPIVLGTTQGGSLAAMKYHEVANELDPSTGEKPACIHMICVGRSKIKIYEGGMIEAVVTGKSEKTAGLTIDQNGNILLNCDGTFQVNAKDIRMIAKDKLSEFAGDTAVIGSKKSFGISGENIVGFCQNGVVSFNTKYRTTQF